LYIGTTIDFFPDAKDSPPNECNITYPGDCGDKPNEGCIISALINQTTLLIEPTSTTVVRQEALKYILHFFGDMHQPLHTEHLKRGGNLIPVCWEGNCNGTNLHGVWDDEIPMRIAGVTGSPTPDEYRKYAAQWAEKLTASMTRDIIYEEDGCQILLLADFCVLPWVREVNHFNCKYVFRPSPDALVNKDLAGAYYDGAKPIVEYLIGKAGARLALWLETTLALGHGPAYRKQYALQNIEFPEL
jgi:nuclease S1